MTTPTKSLRLRPRLRGEIERMAKRRSRSFSEVAQDLLEEALRMRACPGIYFADEPAGREAKVAGTGLGVWEVIRDLRAVKGEERRLKQVLPQLSAAQVRAAQIYYRTFRKEIDAEIAENAALTPRALRKLAPGLVRPV